jgi:hypothetical protein
VGRGLDAPRAFQRWLVDHRRALGDIVEHGTRLDREDVDALLGLSIPGIDELIAMVEIVRLTGAAPQKALTTSSSSIPRPPPATRYACSRPSQLALWPTCLTRFRPTIG